MLYRKILAVILMGGLMSFVYADSQRYENDVGVDSIIYPGAYHTQYIIMTPVARVKNYGTFSQNNVPVVCSIFGAQNVLRYTNTQTIVSLLAGDTARVVFSSWTPTIYELLRVIMRTNLSNDSNPLNDRKTRMTQITSMMINESFEETTFPPIGWRTIIGSGSYNWIRATSGTNPTCTPYDGNAMAAFQSYMASAGSWARLISPPINLGPTPFSPLLSFYMYHDSSYPGGQYGPDSVKIEISTDGINFNRLAAFRRYEPVTGWIHHAIRFHPMSGIVYISFLAFSEYGSNMYIDYVRFPTPIEHDVGVETIISPQASHHVNTAMIPVGLVENYGWHLASFPVICSIIGANGALRYTNTQNVSSLEPGDTIRVNFSAWTPTVLEQCTVKMRADMSGDDDPTNDGKMRTTLITNAFLVEGFNALTFPPLGWQAIPIVGTYNWQRWTTYSGIPEPFEGPAAAYYQSFLAPAGSMARLITPPIAPLSNNLYYTLHFWMYHDPAHSSPPEGPDSLKIEYSLNDTDFYRIAAFRRYEPGDMHWSEHTVNLGPFNDTFYIGFLAYSEYGENIYIDYVRLMPEGIAEEKTNNISITILNLLNPNPVVNGLTHISFSLAEPSKVLLKIYNTSGRLIKTLVNEFKRAGVYNVNWNCRDDVGRTVVKGVYFCTLESPKFKFCKKLVLIQN